MNVKPGLPLHFSPGFHIAAFQPLELVDRFNDTPHWR
jgi:hypothetical protein